MLDPRYTGEFQLTGVAPSGRIRTMTISAAPPAPDQWERDLTELLGLGGDGKGATSAGTRYKYASLLAMMTIALTVMALGIFVLWQRWAVPTATHSTLVDHDVVQRPVPPIKLALAPALPVARPGGAEDDVRARGSSPPGLHAKGGPTSLASARPAIQVAPEASTASRASFNHALSPTRGRSMGAARVTPEEKAVRPRPTRAPTILVSRGVIDPSADDRSRLIDAEKVVVAGGNQPFSAPGTRSSMTRDIPDAEAGPAPRSLRAQPREKRMRDGQSVAIDAIRLLRRQ